MLELSVPVLAACAVWTLAQAGKCFGACGVLIACHGRVPVARGMLWRGVAFGAAALFLAACAGFVWGGLS